MRTARASIISTLIACAPAADAPHGARNEAPPETGHEAPHDAPSHSPPMLIGLLSLPQVFGTEACDDSAPENVVLYGEPDSSNVIGSIRVVQPLQMHAVGGCDGRRVGVHLAGTDSATRLPFYEHSYEAPAAVVIARQGPWFRIRLEGRTAWVRSTDRNRFYALPELLTDNLTYVANPDGYGLATSPGSADRSHASALVTVERSVRVLGSESVGEQLWLRVSLLSHSICDTGETPNSIAEGWLPANSRDGAPTIWFYSRGC